MRGQHGFDAERGRDLGVRRTAEYVGDGAKLPHPAADDDGDRVAHGEGFDAIVRDQDRGRAGRLQQRADLPAEPHPRRRIERGERLVEQEQPRIRRQGARQGDALRFPA